jgi:hypothetical protein
MMIDIPARKNPKKNISNKKYSGPKLQPHHPAEDGSLMAAGPLTTRSVKKYRKKNIP